MRFLPLGFLGLSLSLFACSAASTDDNVVDEERGDDLSGTGGDGSAVGSGSTTGAGGDINNGTGAAAAGGASTGGDAGTGGANAGSGGEASGTGGSGTVSCTPGTGVEDVGADSFLDRATCLTWQKKDTNTGTITNRSALAYCTALAQDGLTWRLPTAQELKTYPNLPTAGNAYLAGPTFIANSATDVATGCTGNSHSCNLAQYSAGNFSCAWQGPGANAYPVLCVSGTPEPSTLDAAYSVATCCASSSTFTETDCSAY